MTDQGPQDHEYKSQVFPQYKKPMPVVDVNRDMDGKTASSLDQASKDIETTAKTMTNIPSIQKDPSSRFMTSRDVSQYQNALNLGRIVEVKHSSSSVMAPPKTGNPSGSFVDALQGCPVCSITTRSIYPMEWVEDASLFHCIKCGLDIRPEDPLQDEILPEEQTNFGLSAIDDVNPEHMAGSKPFLAVSNRNRKTQVNAFDRLKDYRRKNEEMKKLKGFKKSS